MQKSSQVSPMRLGPCDAAIYQISVVQILLGSVYKVFEVHHWCSMSSGCSSILSKDCQGLIMHCLPKNKMYIREIGCEDCVLCT